MITVHWRTARRILAASASVIVLAGTGIAAASEARADGYLSGRESAYVVNYSQIVCDTIAAHPSLPGVVGVVQGVADTGHFVGGDAVDVVNASVLTSCPEWWPLLEAVGAQFRAAQGGQVLA